MNGSRHTLIGAAALAIAAFASPPSKGETMQSPSFAEVLHSVGPAPDRADKLKLYAFLVGRWDTELIAHAEDGVTHKSRGEIHAGWVLEGRAIQDVWMTPPRAERDPAKPLLPLPVTGSWYGTTLRIYDPKLDAWHILWSDPATQVFTRQIGRAEGADIVQIGTVAPGVKLRWRFTEIAASSFRWLGEISRDDGKTWRLQVEVRARRAGAP
jgi:hypothetical protein